MKRLIPLILLVFAFIVTIPSMAKAVTPRQNTLDQVTHSMEELEKDLATAQEAYGRYEKAGKLYEPANRFLKACELIEKMEDVINRPEYNYRKAIKGGWTKDNAQMKKCLDRMYEFYTGKAKIPDAHFIEYLDGPEYPENDTLKQMCGIMRAAYLTSREIGIAGADKITDYLNQRDRRQKRMMEGIKQATLDGSTRYATADFQEKPVYKRAMAIIERYEELCDKVLGEVKVKRDAVKADMQKLLTVYKEMNELLFKDIYNEDYAQADPKVADALDKFEKELWPAHGDFIEGLAKKWAPKSFAELEKQKNTLDITNEVNGTVKALLGKDYRSATSEFKDPGNMVANILTKKPYLPKIRKACSMQVLGQIKRRLSTVKHLAENLQGEAFGKALTPLPLVFRFDPDNTEAKELQAKFKDQLAKLNAQLNAKIDAREWMPAHSGKAPSDAVAIGEAAWKILLDDKTWNGGHRHMIALKVIGEWSVMERNILKAPVKYGIPISVVTQFDNQKGKDLCWNYQLMFFTKKGPEIKPALPLTYYAGSDRQQMRISKVKPGIVGSSLADEYITKQLAAIGAPTASSVGGSSSGSLGLLVRLATSLLLIVAGLLAAAPVVTAKIAALKDPLGKLEPHSSLIGVATLGAGLVSFLGSLLSFCPLASILPQGAAVANGLLLGKSILLKKAPVTTDEEKPAEEATKAAQDLLIKNKALFDKLENVQVPIGLASVVLGVLHLLLGGFWLF